MTQPARYCFACGTLLPERAHFCPQCGQALAAAAAPPADDRAAPARPADAKPDRPPGERRPVTVLFADLAGFTRLSASQDPEEVHRLLSAYFAAVDRAVVDYGGRIDKHIGDAVMGVFGAPVAHSDDRERAVRAACEIHRTLQRLSLELGRPLQAHVGLASGEVVAAGTGSAAHTEYTVTGDAVNLASRLDSIAEGGQTLVSGPLWRAVAHLFDAAPVGSVTVKGLDAPVEVWRILGERQTAHASLPMIGRRGEVRQFAAALEALAETGRGHLVLLRGDAGIGKTRLTEEMRAMAEGAGLVVHTGLVLDFGMARGRGAVASIVAGLLGATASADESAREAALVSGIGRGQAAPDDEPFLRDLLELPQPEALRATYEAMDTAARARARAQALQALLRAASSERPRLLVVEDLHWADAFTLESLAALARACAGNRALLLMTTRPDGDPLDARWRAALGPGQWLTLDLAPLAQDEALDLARTMCAADERLVRACVTRAEGNPLFLVQLVHAAQEAGTVPESIQSLVLSRVDRLPARDRLAIQAAAVIGQRFGLDLLRHLIGEPEYGCAALVEHHLVRPEGEEMMFAHALICEGAYASLLNARKRELHRKAAAWYAGRDSLLRAQHLDRAQDPEAAVACLEAARELAATLRLEAARLIARRAAELAPDDATRHAAAMLGGELLREAGRYRESIEAFSDAARLAPNEAARCRALIGVALGHRLTGEPETALDALVQAGPIAERLGLTLERSTIHYTRGCLRFAQGEVEACLAEHETALAAAREAGDGLAEANALSGLGDARYAQGRMRSSFDSFRECVGVARARGLPRVESANLSMMGNSRVYLNECDAAIEDITCAQAIAERLRHPFLEMLATESLALTLLHRGELDRCEEATSRALAMARALGSKRFEAILLWIEAQTCLERARDDEGRERLLGCLELLRTTGTEGFIGAAAYGTLALASKDPADSAQALAHGGALLARGSLAHSAFSFHRNAAEFALREGDWPGVERHCAALERLTAAESLPWVDFHCARLRALAAWRQGDRGAMRAGQLEALKRQAACGGMAGLARAIESALGE